jgi:hypothetical protein
LRTKNRDSGDTPLDITLDNNGDFLLGNSNPISEDYPIDYYTQDYDLCSTSGSGATHCREVDLNHQNNVPTKSCDESATINCGNWVEYRNVDGEVLREYSKGFKLAGVGWQDAGYEAFETNDRLTIYGCEDVSCNSRQVIFNEVSDGCASAADCFVNAFGRLSGDKFYVSQTHGYKNFYDIFNGLQMRTGDWARVGPGSDKRYPRYQLVTFSDAYDDFYAQYNAEGFDKVHWGVDRPNFKPTNTGRQNGQNGCECLKPVDGKEVLAAALEKRRYAGWLGCTTEFENWKGITYDDATGKMYVAISQIGAGMKSNHPTHDDGTLDHIRIRDEDSCGCVMEMEVDSSMHAVSAKMLVCGKKNVAGGQCVVDGIARPDNVALIPEYQQLLIGEGSSQGTRNNLLWVYDLPSRDLTRVASVPTGAGATSPYWFTVGPWSYISMVAPHPEGDDAYVGYVGPFPRKSGMHWTTPRATWQQTAYPIGHDVALVRSSAVVHIDNGVGDFDVGYDSLHRSGDTFDGKNCNHVAGRVIEAKGSVVYGFADDGFSRAETGLVSQDPDFSSILNVDGKIFSVTHYTSPRPSVAYLSELEQDSETGKLTVTQTKPVDFSAHGGLWTPRAGTVTPWETHLGAEQDEPDARAFYDGSLSRTDPETLRDFLRYFGAYVDPALISPARAMDEGFFPYRYGYAWETVVSADFTEETTKLYALGRQSYKGLHVMPDKKTVYSTDGDDYGGLFKFVADTAGDLTEGVNYCAKFTQKQGDAAVDFTADISWIEMPRASAAEVEAAIELETFDTLFQAARCLDDGSCADVTFRKTNTGRGCECLKPRSVHGHNHIPLAAALEKRRYAAWLGCTTEFTGLKGITFDAESMTIYTSIAAVDSRMEHGFSELGTADHISLTGNSCGCIMAIDVDHGFSGTFARMLVCGDNTDNGCSTKTISNPDDVAMIPEYRQLMIGEDRKPAPESNSLLWIYDLDLGGATRIASVALPAEENSFSRAMAPSWFTVGRWSYVGVVASFVGGSSSWLHQSHVVPHGADQATAQVGYLGPIPSIRPGHVPTYHWGRFPMCICCRNQICFVPHKVFDFAALGSVIASWTSTGLKSVLLKSTRGEICGQVVWDI